VTATAVPSDLRTRRTAALALIAVTAVWGSTFGLSKDLIERLPVADYLGLRYLVAATVLLVVCPRLVRGLTSSTVRVGVGLGVLYAVAQLLQFHGLQHTAPTVSAFVVAMYVVFTPLIAALLPGHRVERITVAAVVVATAGVATMSLRGWAFGAGEALTLLSAVLYAVHILALGRWSRRGEALALTFVQLGTMGVLLTATGAADGLTLPGSGDLLAFLYLAAIAGTVTLLVQTWAQGHLESGNAAVLMVLEPVWAAAFGALLWQEALGPRTLTGGALILIAMLMVVARPGAEPVAEPPTAHA
jgi:drug/metabolite transporter (DMT)-like permease